MKIQALMADRIDGFAFHTNRVNDNDLNRLHILPEKIENVAEAFRLMSAYGAIISYTLTHSIASKSDLPTATF
jgi:hypothetical protein